MEPVKAFRFILEDYGEIYVQVLHAWKHQKGKNVLKGLKVVDFSEERMGIDHASRPRSEAGRRAFCPRDQGIKQKVLN